MADQVTFNCAATMIGSVPYTDPGKAWQKISKYLKDLPGWPQLPMRANLENMYIQYSEGFPGIIIDGQKISVERGARFDQALEKLFSDSFQEDLANYAISKEYSAGLHYLSSVSPMPVVKGQITGPISWGLCVTDSSGRGIIYDETLADAIAGFLKLKARWRKNSCTRLPGEPLYSSMNPISRRWGRRLSRCLTSRSLHSLQKRSAASKA
jgi:hypothetical protein